MPMMARLWNVGRSAKRPIKHEEGDSPAEAPSESVTSPAMRRCRKDEGEDEPFDELLFDVVCTVLSLLVRDSPSAASARRKRQRDRHRGYTEGAGV